MATLDERVRHAIADCEEFIAARQDALALPREAAAFAHALVRASRAATALEIGTSYGYSGLWIGAALRARGGTLLTIDKEPHKLRVAEAYFAEAGLAEVVRTRIGSAIEVIAALEGPFDFVLNDADKENCRRYVEQLLPKLSEGAIILTDNTTTHAGELAGFVGWARSHEKLLSVHIPIGNGMEMSLFG